MENTSRDQWQRKWCTVSRNEKVADGLGEK